MKKFLRLLLLAALMVPLGARAQQTLPINMGFEDETTFNLWTMTNCHSSTGRTNSVAYDGSYAFSFRWTTSPNQFLISPEFSPATGTEALSFWYKSGSYDESFEVGFSSTTNDTASFTWQTPVDVDAYTDWTEYTVMVPTGTKFMAIKSTAYDAYYLYIDEIYIGEAPTCFRVQSIEANNITSSEMTINWVDTNNTSTTYTLVYTDGSEDTVTLSNLSGTSYTLFDLEAATTYYFSVTPDCSDGSIAPRSGSATTDINCENGACNITFNMVDSYGDGWNDNAINVYQGSVLLGSATIDYGNSETMQISVCSGIPVTLTFVSGSYPGEMGGTVTDGGGNTIFTIADMANYIDGAILANVSNPCPSCIAPVNLDTVMNEDGDIVLTWSSEASSFSVYDGNTLVASGITDTFYAFSSLSASSMHILGVSAVCSDDEQSGIVTLSITTPCGAITSMPWSTGFESDVAYTAPMCWTVVNSVEGYSYDYPSVYGYTSHTGNNSLNLEVEYGGDTNLIVSSPITYNPSNLQVKFWIYAYLYNGIFEAGMMTNPYDASTFVPLKTVSGSSPDYYSYTWWQYEFYTDSLDMEEGDTAYLAFRLTTNTNYAYLYLDDIEMSAIPDCRMPLTGSGVIDSIRHESAHFSWDGTSENGYDLMLVHYNYNAAGFPTDTVVNHIFTENTSITIDTLVANTYYQAYVATVCEDESVTDYLTIGTFQTQMRCYPVSQTRLAAVTNSAVALTWNYLQDMGILGTGAILTLTDLSNPTAAPVVTTVMDNNYTFTGLVPGHNYSVTLNSLCGTEGDTAMERTLYFTTHTPACVQAFTEETASNYGSSTPMNTYSSSYGYSQAIYLPNALADLDTLTGVSYNAYWYDEAYTGVNNFSFDMYIGFVDTADLTLYNGQYYLTSAIPVDASMSHVVNNGTYTVTHNGWFYIPFDAPYALPSVLDSSKRIVVTVTNSVNSIENSSNSWRAAYDYTYDSEYNYYYKARYYTEYSTPIDPTSTGLYTYGSSYIPNIQFHGNCDAGCVAPNASFASATGNSITIQIFANGAEASWQVEYKSLEDTAWTLAGTVTGSPYTINGLNPGTGYQIRVGANCTDTIVFSTPFIAYTSCVAVVPPYSVSLTSTNPCWSSNYSSPNSTYGYNIYSDYYLISPEIAVPLDTIAVTINARTYSVGGTATGLQVMACDADGSNAVTVAICNVSNTAFEDVTVYLVDYTGTQNHFMIHNYDGGDVYVKAVSINYLPSCMPVSNITLDTATATTMTLHWQANSPVTNFTVNYRSFGATAWSFVNVASTSTTLTGLTASTNYEVQIISNCPDGTSMTSATELFATECVPMTVPYSQMYFLNLPACWSVNTVGHPNPSWDESVTYGYGYIASQAVYNTSIANDWLMTPAIVIPATAATDSVMIVYKIAGSIDTYSSSSIARYELLVDPTGGFNFTDTLTIDTILTETFEYRHFSAASYAGQTIRVAFRNTSTYAGMVAMYDFGVRSILNPLYYIAGENNVFVGDANGYKAVRVEGETGSIGFTWTSTMAAAGQATISGANTDSLTITYTAAGFDTITMVAANTYGSDTNRIIVHVFDLSPVTLFPYTTGFETSNYDNNSWITLNGDNAWTLGTAADDAGNQSLMISNDGVNNAYTITTTSLSYVYRAFNISDTGDYSIRFDWKAYGESNYDFIRAWMIPDAYFNVEANVYPGGTSSAYDLSTATISNWLPLGGKLNQDDSWSTEYDTVHISAPGRYFLTFLWINDVSVGTQPPAAIDNIEVNNGSEPILCAAPAIDTVYAGETEVTLQWTGTAVNYEVAAIAGNWVEPTAPTSVAVNNYTFTGLTASTQYTLGVRAVCGEGNYSDWTVTTVTTEAHPCYAPTAVTATNPTFDGATIAWTVGEEGQSNFELHITAAGVDTLFATTSNPVTVTGLPAATAYTVTVRAICGEGDYSEWSAPSNFSTATCQMVEGVRASATTATTATITWTANGSSSYEVAYGITGTSRENCTRLTANTNSITINGLAEATTYDVYVRSVCAASVTSDWSDVVTFETQDVAIDDVDNASISLYPNPASSTVTLTGIEGDATVTVVDMNGRESGKWKVESGKLTIDVTGYAQGAYFVRITGERVNAIRKLIVR